MEHPEMTIGAETYTFVTKRSFMPVSVYKGKDTFLRIGPEDVIKTEIAHHRKLEKYGFPLATILHEGTHNGEYYFVETSLGSEHLGKTFTRKSEVSAWVSDADFARMLHVVEKFAQAQIVTANTEVPSWETVRALFQVDTILEELPELSEMTNTAYERIVKRIVDFPFVLTHGDFNPYNLFEKGVIDWERGSYAPFGYDLVSNIVQSSMFPSKGAYEFTNPTHFTEQQVAQYYATLDALTKSAGLPSIAEYQNEYILCRCIWSVVGMHRWPKIQAWRHKQYHTLLKEYLDAQNLRQALERYKWPSKSEIPT